MTKLAMSPSMYKNWKPCNRKALIDSRRFLGNYHTIYGRAFEDGCKCMLDYLAEYASGVGELHDRIKNSEDEDIKARDLIVGLSFLRASKIIIKFSLEQHREKNVYTLAIGLSNAYYWLQGFLDNHTVLAYEERLIVKGPNFTLAGAYDFMARDNRTGDCAIYDFKGITSPWNYSFPSDIQIPVYTVLKQMILIAQGKSDCMSLNSGYVINMTSAKKEDDPFLYVPVDTALVLPNLENMMEDFIFEAKKLEALQSNHSGVINQYMNSDVNLGNCHMNFSCFNVRECTSGNFGSQTFPDDRVFDRVVEIAYSDTLLKEAIKKIRANTSVVNLVTGDGTIGGDQLSESDINDYYGSQTLSLGDL